MKELPKSSPLLGTGGREQTPLERFKAELKLHTVGINYLTVSSTIYVHLLPLNQPTEVEVNSCVQNNVKCLNGGTCVPNGNEFKWHCAGGFAGEFCGK